MRRGEGRETVRLRGVLRRGEARVRGASRAMVRGADSRRVDRRRARRGKICGCRSDVSRGSRVHGRRERNLSFGEGRRGVARRRVARDARRGGDAGRVLLPAVQADDATSQREARAQGLAAHVPRRGGVHARARARAVRPLPLSPRGGVHRRRRADDVRAEETTDGRRARKKSRSVGNRRGGYPRGDETRRRTRAGLAWYPARRDGHARRGERRATPSGRAARRAGRSARLRRRRRGDHPPRGTPSTRRRQTKRRVETRRRDARARGHGPRRRAGPRGSRGGGGAREGRLPRRRRCRR